MKSITIPKGELESPSEVLAHLTLTAAVLPKSDITMENQVTISILGSIDRENFYPVHSENGDRLYMTLSPKGIFWTLSSETFEGPQFIKFQLNKTLKEDYTIFLNENSAR